MNAATDTTDQPQQLRLPGQAAAPDGPVDMKNMYLFHFAFRRDLDAFVRAAQATPVADRATWEALGDRWALFAHQLHVHHTHEDAHLWPAMRVKAGPQDLELLDAMEAEHDQIDPLLDGCRAGFEAMRSVPTDDERAALVVRLVAARDELHRHLSHEEQDAIAVLQRVLTVAEWEQVEKKMQADGGLRHVVALVPWATYGVPEPELSDLMGSADAPLRLIWRLTRRRFAAREQVAFRYA